MKHRNVVLVVALSLVGVVGSHTSASAATWPPPPPEVGVPVALPPVEPAAAQIFPVDGVPSVTLAPSARTGCFGQTDNPHNSTHYPGYALVSSRTVCTGREAEVTVDLYRELFGAWFFLDRGGPAIREDQVRTNAKWRCPYGSRQHFRGVGYHTATNSTLATTYNDATFRCR